MRRSRLHPSNNIEEAVTIYLAFGQVAGFLPHNFGLVPKYKIVCIEVAGARLTGNDYCICVDDRVQLGERRDVLPGERLDLEPEVPGGCTGLLAPVAGGTVGWGLTREAAVDELMRHVGNNANSLHRKVSYMELGLAKARGEFMKEARGG